MSDKEVNLTEVSNQNLAIASNVRNEIVNKLTQEGIPDDAKDMDLLLRTLDGMERTSVQILRLDGESESRDIDRQAIEIANRMFESNPDIATGRDIEGELVDQTLQVGAAPTGLPTVDIDTSGYTFNSEELSTTTTSVDWEQVSKEQEAINKAEEEAMNKPTA